MLPSATVTSLMLIEGASSAGQIPLLSSTETLLELELADAASGRPSPLKSPTATQIGYEPTAAFTGGLKAPVPVPSSTLTVPGSWLAVTRSILPSPLKSAMATDRGCEPATWFVKPPKEQVGPVPVRSHTMTSAV